jgi:hypothetical protein
MRSTGSGCRNSSSRSTGTTNSPSGLADRDAIFASTFVRATPTLSGRPTSSRTSRRSRSASSAGATATSRTSRNASSIEPGSTTAPQRSKIAKTALLAAPYASQPLLAKSRSGHSRRARDAAIPLRTP